MGLFNKKEPEPPARQSLAAIVRGIHHAAASTSSMLAQQYLTLLDQFFDKVEGGQPGELKAKMVRVQVTDQHFVLVPLIALVQPKGLALKTLKVEMSVRIEEAELKQATHDLDNYTGDRSSFKVSIGPKTTMGSRRQSDVTDIEMVFEAGEPPEGIMRMIEPYTGLITPQTKPAEK
jgi:hypothetical protein